MSSELCSLCGHEFDLHDRHVRFRLPEPVLELPGREETAGTWMSHATAQESVMMQVPDAGAFVRALLPVSLVAGHTITYGVWLAIDPRRLEHIFAVWWEPEYADLRITGWLANSVPPWGMLAAPVEAGVRNTDHTPYCERSSDALLNRVLNDEWSHDVLPDMVAPN